jgi:hypothetical protein
MIVNKHSGPLETYMIVNFRICGINRGTRKLTRTPTLIEKKRKKKDMFMTMRLLAMGHTARRNRQEVIAQRFNLQHKLAVHQNTLITLESRCAEFIAKHVLTTNFLVLTHSEYISWHGNNQRILMVK